MMNKIWGSALVAMGAVAGLGGVAEAAVQTELALVIDGSGSISSSNFSAQRTAYQTALQNVFNAHPSFFGQVAIGVWQFSTGVQLEQAIIEIDSQTDLDTVKTAIANMVQLNGNTAIGDGITTARTSLLTNGIDSNRQVIDVSTDGFNNVGSDPDTAADAAVAAGVEQVNAIGIGAGADTSFIAGTGSFAILVSNFSTDLQNALEQKIVVEVQGVPLPPAVWGGLSLLGMIGVMQTRRRRSRELS